MKCPICTRPMAFTGCDAPNCTAYGCEACGIGCDLPYKMPMLSRCANAVANAATRGWEPQPISAVMGQFVDTLGSVAVEERMPVTRVGVRERISPQVRRGVYMRDRGRCQLCGGRPDGGELDHIVPWSAGGADTSDNLRVACVACNQKRSNYRHIADAKTRMTPVATGCDVCSPGSGFGRKLAVFCMGCKRNSTAFASNTI